MWNELSMNLDLCRFPGHFRPLRPSEFRRKYQKSGLFRLTIVFQVKLCRVRL